MSELDQSYLDQSYLDQSQLLARVGGCLSIFGSLSVFAIYFFFSASRSPANRLFLFVSLSDLLNASAFIIAEVPFSDPGGAPCQITAFLIEAFCLSSIFWSGIMALNLILSVQVTKTTNAIVRYEYLYHIVVWSLSVIPALLMIFIRPGGHYIYGASPTSAWCTITDEFSHLRFVIFYVPIWFVFIFVLVSYVSVGVKMARTHRLHKIEARRRPDSNYSLFSSAMMEEKSVFKNVHMQRYFRASSVYVLAIFIAWAPASANRIYQEIAHRPNPNETLVLFRSFTAPGAGFLNFLACLIVIVDLWAWKRKRTKLRQEFEAETENELKLSKAALPISCGPGRLVIQVEIDQSTPNVVRCDAKDQDPEPPSL